MGVQIQKKRVKLFFKTLDEAKKFALKRNFLFEIILPAKRKILKKIIHKTLLKKKCLVPTNFVHCGCIK